MAPAGDLKSFEAAVANGANAVYLGLSDFNARMKAQNFGTENLREIVERAHFFGVKVYVTVNTILQNSELNDMLSLVKAATLAKVDAFLVQDLGVCALLRDRFEGIVLHASTQMGIHNAEGAKVAESMGIKRVVLSRETTLEDIREIRRETSLELEYFVQGALCVAFSGECYLSSVEQGASGNRGLCKQMCRLPYEAKLGDLRRTGYLLSARDLCLAESIKQLRDAGVTSFKIEGRMRREGYVAKAVSVYRKFVYGAEDKLSAEDAFALKTAFSRGEYLSRAYLDEGTPSVVEPRFNNHIGEEIGKVVDVKPFKKELFEVTLRSSRAINDGDGLKFFDGDAEMASLGAGGIRNEGGGKYKFVTSARVKEGWSVRLTLDGAAERALMSNVPCRQIRLEVDALCGQTLKMRAECDVLNFEGERVRVAAEAESSEALERAKTAPVSEDMLREQATKTAYAGFAASSCEVRTDGVFAARSAVNFVRRELLEKLRRNIIAEYEKNNNVRVFEPLECRKFENRGHEEPKLRLHTVMSEDLSESVILRKGELGVLAPATYTAQEVERMLSALELTPKEVALKLPPLARGRDLARIDALLREVPIRTLVAESLYGLSYAARGYRVIAGAGMNVANDHAALEATRLGAYAVVPSLEFKCGISNAAAIADGDGSEKTHGEEGVAEGEYALQNSDENGKRRVVRVCSSDYRYPLMTLAHCPYKTLFENDCEHCSYAPGLTLSRERRVYRVRRVRVDGCIFELYGEKG